MIDKNFLIFKNSAILYVRLIVSSILGLFSARFLLSGLGNSDFGLYNVVGGIVVMMAFFNSVMISTTNRFIAFETGKGNEESINKIFNISLVLHIVIALLILLFTETLGVFYVENYLNVDISRVSDSIFVLRFSSYATIITVISIPYQGVITANENFLVRGMIEILRSFLALGVAISLMLFVNDKIRLYSLLISIVNIIPAILFFIYCAKKYPRIIKFNFQKNKLKYKEMLSFSSWNLIGASAHLGKSTGASLIINNFFGTILNAAFGIANQLNTIVLMFSMNLAQAAIPQITKSFSVGNKNRTLVLAAYISKYTWYMMLIPALPLILETKYLLSLWLDTYPENTVIFCRLMIVGTLISGLGNGLSSVVEASGKVKYFQIVLSTTSLLSLPIAYFVFFKGGNAYWIFIIIIIANVINVIMSQILLRIIINFDVKYFLKTSFLKILYVLIMICPLLIIHAFIPEGVMRFLVFSTVTFLWTLFSIYMVGIDNNEKEILKGMIKKTLRLKKT
ncbi:hypothetical protein DS884_17520 [Tenacibaculum sp. E3R01]|uniref:hypothetical protein n=1 Tax=Tenacibaculum sp. E3R01 TaxID=2267227 RepID=UPI000DEB1C60|nr:hypothetical protein [Tenacibaculum sp. E3R01]RBW54253.1 hypothetical protein DS884_17520 [Tenacibaculum sp. E3R01]